MVSEVEICNRALVELHANPITSLADESEEGVACNATYDQLRDEVLRAHPWNFAIEQKKLQQNADAPLFDFNAAYNLPEDCLRVLRIDTRYYRFKIKGRELHTDAPGVNIEYIKKETDTTKFDPMFVTALVIRLKASLANPLTGSVQAASNYFVEYEQFLKDAKRRDGQEGTPDDVTADLWVDSRYNYPYGTDYYG